VKLLRAVAAYAVEKHKMIRSASLEDFDGAGGFGGGAAGEAEKLFGNGVSRDAVYGRTQQ